MTVSKIYAKSGPYAKGGTSYNITFPYTSTAELAVYVGDNKVTSGFSISGSTVTFTSATTNVVTIVRNMDFSQSVDLQNGQAFYPDVIETGLDKIVKQTQQLKEEVDRAIKVPFTSTKTPEQYRDDLLADIANVTTMKDEVTSMKGEVTAMKNEVTSMENSVSTMKSEVTTIKSEITTAANNFKVDIDGAKAEIDAYTESEKQELDQAGEAVLDEINTRLQPLESAIGVINENLTLSLFELRSSHESYPNEITVSGAGEPLVNGEYTHIETGDMVNIFVKSIDIEGLIDAACQIVPVNGDFRVGAQIRFTATDTLTDTPIIGYYYQTGGDIFGEYDVTWEILSDGAEPVPNIKYL